MRYILIAVLVVSVAFTASRGVAQGRDPLEFMPPEAWGNIPPEVVARILEQRKRIVYVSIGPIQEQVRTRDGVRDTDDCLVLNSRDRISGRLVGITPDGLVEIQNPFFVKPIKFHVRDVRRIIPARKGKILAGPDTIFLTNGLRISGTVLVVTDEAVSLETASMGRVSIKKNVIASITFRATENVVLDTNFPSGSASPWQTRAGRWVIRDGRFRCLTFLSWTHAPLRQEGPMTFEWTVSELSNQPSGAVMFFVEDVAGIWSENAIYVQPTWNSIQVLRVQRSHTPIIFSKRFGRVFSRATFRAAYDPETGRLKLWVNGFALGECFIRPIVKRGRFINLYARNASVFEHVRVVRGAEGVAGRITPHKTLDQIILISKDKVSGKVISFSDGIARVETAYGSLAFKKRQIHRIVFHTKDLRRMTRREGDATVAFYGGAVLPVRVNSMNADSLRANIDFLGDVNISRKAIRLLIAPTRTLALDLGSGVSLKMALVP
ncbi:MAG: hypothetical protein QF662_00915, partial [Phycisphaerae bacterium]|nr:hypothetical protein [Phycisphaerae bacterium]